MKTDVSIRVDVLVRWLVMRSNKYEQYDSFPIPVSQEDAQIAAEILGHAFKIEERIKSRGEREPEI